MVERLTHVDEAGAARMVDVSGKDVTVRTVLDRASESIGQFDGLREPTMSAGAYGP